ncbi:MAG: SpoIIE family protein phosphatase [Rhodospirillales bacterium]|nr:SpoIIE family protein phosphatase [Rhodospirillales bacterium]
MLRSLVIDDNQQTEGLLRRGFEAIGANIEDDFVFADCDEAALRIIGHDDNFDLAFVSIDSPKISGLELFRKIPDKQFRIPRIALTENRDITVVRKAMNDGAADFLVKPFSFEDIAATMERVYRQVERRRRAWAQEAELSSIRREISIAADIQQRILPKKFPDWPGLDIHAEVTPAKDMGGDFYDVFALPDDRVGFVIADVSGKSVPAAFYMAVARTLMRANAPHFDDPADCLAAVNLMLCRHDIPGVFVSVFYALYSPHTGEIRYANGGHPPPLLRAKDGTTVTVEGGQGTVLGVTDALPYESGAFTLAPGEMIYMCTDGVWEAFDNERNQFGLERLRQCLANGQETTAADIARAVNSALTDFIDGAPTHDDITSLIIRRS